MGALPYFQVDAFTSELFRGNPAGVCLLADAWLPEALMQRIAFENNLSETAFLLPAGDHFCIRWFTPEIEIDLCGHATLASAFVLFTQAGWNRTSVNFESKSGPLMVHRRDALLELDFPSRPAAEAAAPADLVAALGERPATTLKSRDWLVVYENETRIKDLKPRFDLLRNFDKVIVTAPGADVDFVSRFFAPGAGVDEDPVTGSAHCTLIPYWAARLGKTAMRARQLSRRTGELFCELRGERVGIAGNAVLYSSGKLHL